MLTIDSQKHTLLGIDLVIAQAGTPSDVSLLQAGSTAVVSRAALDLADPRPPAGLSVKTAGQYDVFALIHYTDP